MKFKNYLNENVNYETSKVMGHTHKVSLNADGDGKTVSTSNGENHEHIIFQWIVQPAHGHIHNLDI